MTQTEKFIARLHSIAAASDPLDRQTDAVVELFARYAKETQESLGDDRERIRSRLTGLRFELTKQTHSPAPTAFRIFEITLASL